MITAGSRRLLRWADGRASVVLLRPMVVLAARVMGPGPARLRMVKLAHHLGGHRLTVVQPEVGGQGFEGAPVQPTTRAA